MRGTGRGGGCQGSRNPSCMEFATEDNFFFFYNVTIYMINELTVNNNFVKWLDPPPPGKNSGSAFDSIQLFNA